MLHRKSLCHEGLTQMAVEFVSSPHKQLQAPLGNPLRVLPMAYRQVMLHGDDGTPLFRSPAYREFLGPTPVVKGPRAVLVSKKVQKTCMKGFTHPHHPVFRAELLLASLPLMMCKRLQNKGQHNRSFEKKKKNSVFQLFWIFALELLFDCKQHCLNNPEFLHMYFLPQPLLPVLPVYIPLHLVIQLFCPLFKPWLFKVGELTPSPAVILWLTATLMCILGKHTAVTSPWDT